MNLVKSHLKGKVIGVADRSKFSAADEKQWRKALSLLHSQARTDAKRGEAPWALKDTSLVPEDPSWFSELPADLKQRLKLNLDGTRYLKDLFPHQHDTYHSVYGKYIKRKKFFPGTSNSLESASNIAPKSQTVVPRVSTSPTQHPSTAAASNPGGSYVPHTQPRTLKRLRSFDLNELWIEPTQPPKRLSSS